MNNQAFCQLAPDAVVFRKSSYSGQNGQCVEVGGGAHGARWLRDSKNPHEAMHYFTATAWTSFLREVKDGSFD